MNKRQFFSILLALTAWQVFAFQSEKAPKIKFDTDMYDFGDIDKGKKVETVFTFKNIGDAPLEIQNVTTSCGCTSAKPDKTMYEPGESGSIPVTFNSERFAGAITKRITVTTNDPESPKTAVTIKGNVVTDLTSKPVSVFFPKAKAGEKTTQEISVSTSKLDKLEIKNLTAEPEFLTAELKKIDDQNYTIVVTADGTKFPTGTSRASGSVTYDTNSETQSQIRTLVTVSIQQPIRVSPNSVYFFASKAGQKRETRLSLIASEDAKDFEVKGIQSDLDFIEIKLNEKDKGEDALSVIVTLKENAPEGKFQGTLTMETNLKDQAKLVIPVRGSVIK